MAEPRGVFPEGDPEPQRVHLGRTSLADMLEVRARVSSMSADRVTLEASFGSLGGAEWELPADDFDRWPEHGEEIVLVFGRRER